MPFKGFIINGQEVLAQDALAMARQGLIPYPYPYVARKIAQQSARIRDQEHSDYVVGPSASSIAGCLRKTELKRKFDYFVSIDAYAGEMGTDSHEILERYTDEQDKGQGLHVILDFPELQPPYNKVFFGGTPDLVDHANGVLWDYKFKMAFKIKFDPIVEHSIQTNIYNWLRAKNGLAELPVRTIFYADGITTKTATAPMRPIESVEKWVMERIAFWAIPASQGKLPDRLDTFPTVKANGELMKTMIGPCKYCELFDKCRDN